MLGYFVVLPNIAFIVGQAGPRRKPK